MAPDTCEVDVLSTSATDLHAVTPAPATTAVGKRLARRVVVFAFVAALNNVAFGYDVGVISGSLTDMATSLSLSTFEQEMATSGLNVRLRRTWPWLRQ